MTFTTSDGLAHNTVWAIHSDPDGVLWFGTSRGVSRYDGKGFITFTPADGLPHRRQFKVFVVVVERLFVEVEKLKVWIFLLKFDSHLLKPV